MAHEFAPGTQVGCHHRPPFRIGLQNRFAQRLVCVRRKQSKAGAPNQPVALFCANVTHELHIGQMQIRFYLLQFGFLRAVSCNDQMKIGSVLQRAQQIIYAFFFRKPTTIKKGSIRRGLFQFVGALKMGQLSKTAAVPPMFDELVTDKPARRQKQIDALLIALHASMRVGFGGKRDPSSHPRVAVRRQSVPESAAFTPLACLTVGHHVVAGTQKLEIIEVIKHRNSMRLQFPQYRWREVVIDVSHMRDIGPKLPDHAANLLSGFRRINRPRQLPCPPPASRHGLEIHIRN